MKNFYGYLLLISCFTMLSQASAQTQWQTLNPGLDYTTIPIKNHYVHSQIHAFKIDLANYKLDLAFAGDQKKPATTVKQLALTNNAILAINGGFFTPEHTVIGLRIKQGKIRSPLQNTSWWGVFYIAGERAEIIAQSQYQYRENISTAVQAGPRLVINGTIPSLKPGIAQRSAVCLNKANQLILLVTEQAALSTTALAEKIRHSEDQDGLGCYNALNLDGGHSAQLYANIGDFKLSITGYASITDAILVIPE